MTKAATPEAEELFLSALKEAESGRGTSSLGLCLASRPWGTFTTATAGTR